MEEDYVIISYDFPSTERSRKSIINPSIKSLFKNAYNLTMLLGNISHLFFIVGSLHYLYTNPLFYSAISSFGHGPFLLFYASMLKFRGWLWGKIISFYIRSAYKMKSELIFFGSFRDTIYGTLRSVIIIAFMILLVQRDFSL